MWGGLAKVGIPNFRNTNVGPKSSDCVFIGYAQDIVAYRFMCISDNLICESRNA